LKFTVIINN